MTSMAPDYTSLEESALAAGPADCGGSNKKLMGSRSEPAIRGQVS
jgi:hypothetical protein